MTTLPAGLREQISGLMLADQRRISRQAQRAESTQDGAERDRAFALLREKIGAAETRSVGAVQTNTIGASPFMAGPLCTSVSAIISSF